jgi:hypothetical protein
MPVRSAGSHVVREILAPNIATSRFERAEQLFDKRKCQAPSALSKVAFGFMNISAATRVLPVEVVRSSWYRS